MATPRSHLIDPVYPLHYHLVSRCVRRSFICGKDRRSNVNYEHRKTWLQERLFHLAECFAVTIDAFAIMSNHFHLVVYYDPQDSFRWSDAEVADRWLSAFPPSAIARSPEDADEIISMHRAVLLSLPERLLHARQTLGSLSMFIKHLKQPIAYRANREDNCTGHFFEGRFYSGALLDDNAIIAAMAYVDLNPVRARIINDIVAYEAASGLQRAKVAVNHPSRLAQAVEPLVSGIIKERPALSITLREYLNIVHEGVRDCTSQGDDKKSRWFERISTLKKRQRAFVSMTELSSWKDDRGWTVPGKPMPSN